MFKTNEGRVDRGLRIGLGLVLLGLGFGGAVGGGLGVAIGVVGLVPLVTGIAGWCPLYTVLGMDTLGRRKAAR